MIYLELKRQISEMEPVEIREDSPELFEFVLKTDCLDRLNLILKDRFGPPLKRTHEKPSRDIMRFTEPYGGVRVGQAFYYNENDASSSFVFIWPWGDGEHMTVKIFPEKKMKLQLKSGGSLQRILKRTFLFM